MQNSFDVSAQHVSMSDALSEAKKSSVESLKARYNFLSSYWAYQSFRASLLPSLNLYGSIGNYNRSLTLLQDYNTGDVNYAMTNNMQNSIGLSLTQNISLTGGSFTIYSDLSRIDQFGERSNVSWYSQPITAIYSQPLFGYNRFKWSKLISPKEYEKAKRVYLESIEELLGDVVSAFFSLASAEMKLSSSVESYKNSSRMLDIARSRVALGTLRREDLMQIELRMINDSISICRNTVSVREARMEFNSLLGYDETKEPIPILNEYLPDVFIDYNFAYSKACKNSAFYIDNELMILDAQSEVARAKADRGITMLLNARFGLSKSDDKLRNVYARPLDQEVVGITFNVPIFDWGTGRGKVQKAKAAEEMVRAKVLQSEIDFRRQLFSLVGQFNNQRNQCYASRKARELSEERNKLLLELFSRGESTVTELNNAQKEYDSAAALFVSDLGLFWKYYYALRQITLFDFIMGREIEVNPEELINK